MERHNRIRLIFTISFLFSLFVTIAIFVNINKGSVHAATYTPTATTQTISPTLSIPIDILSSANNKVTLPISYTASGHNISSLLFSVDYDHNLLNFDPTDDDGDGIPDAIRLSDHIPASYISVVSFDAADLDGELDFTISDFSVSSQSLSEGVILSLTLNITSAVPSATEAPILFGVTSFGNVRGDVVGATADGSILIAGPPATISAIADTETLVADGESTSTLTTVIEDASGNPVPWQTVTFSTTLGTMSQITHTSDINGVVTTTLTSSATMGTANVVGTTQSVSTEIDFQFIAGAPVRIQLSASKAVIDDEDSNTSTITATVMDRSDNPISNQIVQFDTTVGTIPELIKTDIDGVAIAILEFESISNSAIVTAKLGDIEERIEVELPAPTAIALDNEPLMLSRHIFLPLVSNLSD